MTKNWTGNGNSIWKTLGASNHTDKERQSEDFYATSPVAIDKLLAEFTPHHNIYECACGQGHLSKRLTERGFNVLSSDLVYRGYGQGGVDFFETNTPPIQGTFDILTNPPYNLCIPYVLHALELIPDDGYVIMFLKTTFLEGKERRKKIFDINPPRWIYQFSERTLCAKNGEFDYMRAHGGSAVAHCFMIWQKENKDKVTEVKWI